MGFSVLFLYLVTGPTDGRKMGQKPGSVQEKFELQTQLTLSLSFADPACPFAFPFSFLVSSAFKPKGHHFQISIPPSLS